MKDSRNKDVDLSIYKGKVLLIVNVAPKCSWANSNYSELSEFYDRYKDTAMANGEHQLLQRVFYEARNYKVMLAKDFRQNTLSSRSTKGFMGSSIKWNFTKFLIYKEGHVIQRYGTTTSPLSIEGDIKKALGQS